jgi:hypothetical protein
MFLLPNLSPGLTPRHLVIAGEALSDNVPFTFRIRVNKGTQRAFQVSNVGPFEFNVLLGDEGCLSDSFHVQIDTSRVFPARDGQTNGPRRMLGFLLRKLEISEVTASTANRAGS